MDWVQCTADEWAAMSDRDKIGRLIAGYPGLSDAEIATLANARPQAAAVRRALDVDDVQTALTDATRARLAEGLDPLSEGGAALCALLQAAGHLSAEDVAALTTACQQGEPATQAPTPVEQYWGWTHSLTAADVAAAREAM